MFASLSRLSRLKLLVALSLFLGTVTISHYALAQDMDWLARLTFQYASQESARLSRQANAEENYATSERSMADTYRQWAEQRRQFAANSSDPQTATRLRQQAREYDNEASNLEQIAHSADQRRALYRWSASNQDSTASNASLLHNAITADTPLNDSFPRVMEAASTGNPSGLTPGETETAARQAMAYADAAARSGDEPRFSDFAGIAANLRAANGDWVGQPTGSSSPQVVDLAPGMPVRPTNLTSNDTVLIGENGNGNPSSMYTADTYGHFSQTAPNTPISLFDSATGLNNALQDASGQVHVTLHGAPGVLDTGTDVVSTDSSQFQQWADSIRNNSRITSVTVDACYSACPSPNGGPSVAEQLANLSGVPVTGYTGPLYISTITGNEANSSTFHSAIPGNSQITYRANYPSLLGNQ
ncbi:MAG: hypothetical protein HY537_12645 [Deltaproteobacteria bacterium]|nr:hypothetical protein [Deltaproteobacteria bacterium]